MRGLSLGRVLRLFAGILGNPGYDPDNSKAQRMKKAYKNCQSCGMPLKRDERGGGTNADGSTSAVYCSHCYQYGQYVLPDITAEQMQARVRQKLVEMGMPRLVTGLFVRGIPKLERWRLGRPLE